MFLSFPFLLDSCQREIFDGKTRSVLFLFLMKSRGHEDCERGERIYFMDSVDENCIQFSGL